MKVSTSLASLLRQPTHTAPPSPSVVASSSSSHAGSTRASGGAPSNATFHVHAHFGLGQGEYGLRGAPEAQLTDVAPGAEQRDENQGVRKRLAALDRMVSNRLEAFAQNHADLDPGLTADVDQLARDFHASVRDAYDAFRETGDRGELRRTLRGALGQAREAVQFISATLPEPAGSGTVVVVDPGQAPGLTESDAGNGETIAPTGSSDDTGGSTSVDGLAGSGVTVEVTDLPVQDDLAVNGSGTGGSGSLQDILADLVAQFGDMLAGIEDLIDSGFAEDDEPSFKLAINLYAEFQVGGSSLGDLLDAVS